MKSAEDIRSEIDQILKEKWTRRKSDSVPEAEDIQLSNDAVEIAGSVLYADMAESTELVLKYKDWFSASVYKSYLRGACDIIRNNEGEITAFDGDRVMAVFVGTRHADKAVKTGLQITRLVREIINPALKSAHPNSTFSLHQSVGIDSGNLLVARTGIRGANDLVWIGRAANYSAKLCSLRQGAFSTFITAETYNLLSEDTKIGGSPKQHMWEKIMWQEKGVPVYRSSWMWKI